MALQVDTNIMALSAQRSLNATQTSLSKVLQQLSTGLRINSASDDAAGFAISEKMRAQINGMQQGLRNAQDSISMIQTAEGSLTQTSAILQRMRELTVQAASTTLSAVDRRAIGDEVATLRSELDNIATGTRFNGLNLLTGTLTVAAAGSITTDTISAGGSNVTATVDAGGVDPTHTFTLSGTGAALTITDNTSSISQTINVSDFASAGSQVINFNALGISLRLTADGPITGADVVDTGTNPLKSATLTTTGTGSATFRTGSKTSDTITVAFGDMRSSALGSGGPNNLDQLAMDNTAVSSPQKADALLASIDAAIDQVSTESAQLGAAQNQMQSATAALGVTVQNLTASESTVRDADIAQTSSNLVADQILQQAGVAVLAQANSLPQAVLQLLKP
jgi:flagellin